jgi:putative serine protease PepD
MTTTSPSPLRVRSLHAVTAAIVGAGILTIVLVATGALGGTARATIAVTPRDPSAESLSLAVPLNAAALYAGANPSVVAITATHPHSVDTGTGFVIDSQGHILTADHVVRDADSVTVKFPDGTTVPGRVLGHDLSTDVAVLKAHPSPANAPALTLGSTASLSVGDTLAVIGNPFGYNHSLSTGVVSALDRTIQAPNGWSIPHAIQTDATINPGNSGGPVLDAQGRVVGIVDQIATGGSGVDSATGVGFAVPIDVVKPQLSALEHGQAVTHPYLGVAVGQSTTRQPGALIETVSGSSPAATAGLQPGELITAVDGTAIQGPSSLVAAIAADTPRQKVRLQVRRGSRTLTVTVTLASQPRLLANENGPAAVGLRPAAHSPGTTKRRKSDVTCHLVDHERRLRCGCDRRGCIPRGDRAPVPAC